MLGGSKCPGHVPGVPEKPKVSEKADRFASSANPTRGIKMDLENGNHDSCIVCKYFTVATRSDIRKLVYDRSRSESVQSWVVKEDLCAKHRHQGFSAHSQTVGRPVPTGCPEGEQVTSPVLLPTFFNDVTGDYIDPQNKWDVRAWKFRLRRFFRKN